MLCFDIRHAIVDLICGQFVKLNVLDKNIKHILQHKHDTSESQATSKGLQWCFSMSDQI